MYNCGCDECNTKAGQLNLSLKDSFKNLLNIAETAFKRLHEKGGYKPEDLQTEKEYQNLIKETNTVFNKAVIDNVIEGAMLESLQKDIYLFSGLKTHAQLFEASRLLVDEKGQQKPFSAFSRDFEKINKGYNQNYLNAEYDYAVGTSQSIARWETFSDDEETFLLQYRTDGGPNVRDSHNALNRTTLPKSDPFWNSYTPKNGWNCHCMTVQVLKDKYTISDSEKSIKAGEAATTQIGKDGKNRLEIFRYNPGKEKVIFPPTHPYGKVAGAKVAKPIILTIFNKTSDRYDGIGFKKEKGIKNGGTLEIFTSGKQNKQEFKKNKKALTIVANNGGEYRMLPIVNDGNANPDAFNLKTKRLVDVKVSEGTNGKNIIQGSMKEASKQGAQELLLHLTKKPDSYKEMYTALRMSIEKNRNKAVETITVVFPDNAVKKYDIERIRQKIRKR